MSIVLVGSTSGSVTLQEPAIAGTTVLDLPATSGTVITSNGSGDIQFNSGYGSVATAYGCRAWVSFNGTGTPAIRASGNVSSITDNGTGDYTINFTTAMPNANYCVSGTGGSNGTANAMMASPFFASAQTTTTSRVVFFSADGALQDSDFNSLAYFR
jgi:hypothetical protein